MSAFWTVHFRLSADYPPRYLSALRKGVPFYTGNPRVERRWAGMRNGTHHVTQEVGANNAG